MNCETCRRATAIFYNGVAIGYFSCALQKAWGYRVACNIDRHEVRT